METVIDFLSTFSSWSVLLPAMIGICVFTRLSLPSKIIWGMTAFAVVPQIITYLPFVHKYKIIIYNIDLLLEVIFYSFYFYILLQEKYRHKKFAILFPILFGIVCFINGFYKNFTTTFFNEAVCFDNFFVLFLLLLVCYNAYILDEYFFNFRDPNIYYFIGIFFYTPFSVLVFLLWEYRADPSLASLSTIHAIVNGLMYLLFAKGLIIDAKT